MLIRTRSSYRPIAGWLKTVGICDHGDLYRQPVMAMPVISSQRAFTHPIPHDAGEGEMIGLGNTSDFYSSYCTHNSEPSVHRCTVPSDVE